MAACGIESGSVKFGSRNTWSCDQTCQVKVPEQKTCNVVSFSVSQKEQSGLSVSYLHKAYYLIFYIEGNFICVTCNFAR